MSRDRFNTLNTALHPICHPLALLGAHPILHVSRIRVNRNTKNLNIYIRTQHDCHHDTKVKPEAATAVIELLMMGRKTPETCRAVNKRQDNKLKSCCIRLVIYLNCTMMHGLTNLKFYI